MGTCSKSAALYHLLQWPGIVRKGSNSCKVLESNVFHAESQSWSRPDSTKQFGFAKIPGMKQTPLCSLTPPNCISETRFQVISSLSFHFDSKISQFCQMFHRPKAKVYLIEPRLKTWQRLHVHKNTARWENFWCHKWQRYCRFRLKQLNFLIFWHQELIVCGLPRIPSLP